LSKIYLHRESTKHKARQLLQQAVRAKRVQRPKRCELCHYSLQQLQACKEMANNRFDTSVKKTYYPLAAHHYNYFFPYKVWWLCDYCHTVLHKAQVAFQYACLDLDAAKSTVFNYVHWQSQGGYPEFIRREKEWAEKELHLLEKKRQKLLNYIDRLAAS
jgi:hypothetical protein